MRSRHMPLAQCGGRILVITEPHHLGHFFLQIDPIKRQVCLSILCQPPFRVVNRIASEDEQLLYSPAVYVPRQSLNAVPPGIRRKPAVATRLTELLWPRLVSV